MNIQRWLALGILALSVACIATSNLWLTPLLEDDDEATATPDLTTTPGDPAAISEADLALTATVTATLNPIVAEMIEEAGQVAASDAPFIVYQGDFTSIDSLHQATGTVSIYQIGESRYVLRLDPFNVANGPDLHIYLTRQETPRTSTEVISNSLDLGLLESLTEAQNIDIPEGTRLQDYKSVAIYSKSLNLVFSTAKLVATRGGNTP
jgi:hypothetical protein